MKKNTMMRLASGLLVAVLLSTCAISGTFAKYVTTADVEDTARVAKWGVTVTATGSLFETKYDNDGEIEKDENGDDIAYTVVSSGTEDVVAPGTAKADGLTFSITGTPEVAVNIDFNISNVKDVLLPKGTYLDYTTGNNDADTFPLDKDYYPIVYILKQAGAEVKKGTMADIEAYLNDIEGNYPAGTNLTTTFGTYTLSWSWEFGDSANNKADTFLGQLAAGIATAAGASTTASATIEITVSQID